MEVQCTQNCGKETEQKESGKTFAEKRDTSLQASRRLDLSTILKESYNTPSLTAVNLDADILTA